MRNGPPPLSARVRAVVGDMPPQSPRLMARSGAFLYGAGGLLVFATLILGRLPGTVVPGVAAVAVIATAVAAGLWIWRDVLPAWPFPALTAAGSVLITLLMYFDGAHASSYSLLYLWAALYACYFYGSRVASAELAWIALLAGLELFLRDPGDLPLNRWLLIVGTSVIAGITVRHLAIRISALADLDGLTELPNRRRMDRELAGIVNGAHARVSVVTLDLDFFRRFNEEMGHRQGDRHLALTAKAWRACLRDGDLISRYRGKQFVAVLTDCDAEEAVRIADRLRAATPNGQTASAGVAQWDRRESAGDMIERADAALYEAKVRGRDRVVLAPGSSEQQAATELPQVWAKMVPKVLESRSIRFAFQPIFELSGLTIHGHEALARPHDSALDISVEGFFAAAQKLGYGRDVDWLCRRLALDAGRQLQGSSRIFVNVSVPALLAPVHGVDQMLLLLDWSGWTPSEVVLEITERDLISDLGRFQEVLRTYREQGFQFAMDDVGDGHSTLEVLAAATPEYIKVARRLTATAVQPGARAAIRAIVAFANSTGAHVIAEGIEDHEQMEVLRGLGCGFGQGFGLGRPQWLTERAERPLMRVV
ncbi:MAG TPA: GGDEF and EAL domain-containing protein [Candidatus Dormibacteraeota bacterium]|nr:GGDEF and EAL domain-containing protein [Candidatus Dormibacteraeota bacterium]